MGVTRDRVMEYRIVRAEDLVRNPKNWRTHPEAQRRGLEQLLDKVGSVDVLRTFVLPDGRLCLFDGHLRADEEVPVLVTDLTQEEADLVLATFDPVSAMVGADIDVLRGLLDDVRIEVPTEVLATLEALCGPIPASASVGDDDPPVDRAAELMEEWGTALGQVWEIPSMTTPGRAHRVVCGSCRELAVLEQLFAGARIHLAFTSPPYASQREYDEKSGFRPIHPDEYVAWFEAVQAGVRRWLEPDGSWFVNIKEHADGGERHLYVKDLTLAHRRSWGWMFVDELCWERAGVPGGWPNRFKNGWEPVFHFSTQTAIKFRPERVSHPTEHAFDYSPENGKSVSGSGLLGKEHAAGFREGMARPSNVIQVGSGGAKVTGDHPAEFPIGLPAFFVQAYSDPADNAYDPFLGSGTTMIAAEREGRVCFGMEISPKYVAVILERARAAGLEPMLVGTPF